MTRTRHKGTLYTVVEQSGMVDETDRISFPAYDDAVRWIKRMYYPGETEELHVQIRRDLPNGTRTYEGT